MKRLLISFLFIVIALYVVDRLGGYVMWQVNQHAQDENAPKLKYLADDVDEDVILLGTSRCREHYVPQILTDSIGLSFYNGGINGSQCVYAHYFALNLILQHHKPKLICLELSTNDYACQDISFTPISFFAPYIGRCEQADSIFRLAGNYWAYRICHLYRYNARAVSNIGGLLVSGNLLANRHKENDNGYFPLSKPKFHPQKLTEVYATTNIDNQKLQYVKKFINLCKSNDIKLVFMVSPTYMIADKHLYDILKDIAKEHQVPFFDYNTQGLFIDHPEYFLDEHHLWDKGARIYTSIFAHDLKNYLAQ